MKRTFSILFFLSAWLLVSCNEDPDIIDTIDGGNKSVITLSAGVAQTKGAELIDADFTSFYLYTYYSDGSLYFEDTVTRDPADSTCSFDTGGSHPWPEDSTLTPLSFYGYYPYDGITPQTSDDGDFYIEYTSPYSAAEQVDLVATSESSDAASSVHLEFDHALSKLNFTLALNNDEVNIRDVKLYYSYKQLATKANYSLKSGTWGDLSEKNYSGEYQFAEYDCSTTNSTHTFDESLFVIPQAVSESAYLSVRVEYTIYNGDTSNHTVQTGNLALVSSESLGNTLADEWKSGYEYNYNLSINTNNEMSFALTVDTREELTAQGNIDLQYISSYGDVTDRIATLWADGARDLVIAGEYSSGKLGYGSVSCPFIAGFGDTYTSAEGDVSAQYEYSDDANSKDASGNPYLFSVDFSFMSNLPTFLEMHGDVPDSTGDAITDIDGNAPSFPKYIFQYAERLEEVILPADVIAIGDFAFQGCRNLKSINMFGTKHVEQCSFQGCTSLTTVMTTGSEGTLTRIHPNGFDGCTLLSTIDLGNIREIDAYGFVNCSSLGETNLSNVTVVGINAFDGCANLDIPKGTDIPNLETISDYAFAKCAKLGTNTDIVINKAKTIGDYAFSGCSALHLGDESTEYDLSVVEAIGKYAFHECGNITKLDISNVTSVGEYAFYNCSELVLDNNFYFENLTDIYGSAFHNCPKLCSLSEIQIEASQIETLGAMAFNNCSDFDFEGTDIQDFSSLTSIEPHIFGDCKELDNPLEFTNQGVTSIGASSFSGCILLPKVTIDPEKITSIGDNAFYNCAAMTEFELKPEIITYLGTEAFHSSSNIKINSDATLTFSVLAAVNKNTFYGCANMANALVFSDNLTSIDSSAFANSGITSISGLDEVASLGEKVFQNCSNLSSITGLDGVTAVSTSCFYGCTSLSTLSLQSAATIGSSAFHGCTTLSELEIPAATTIDDSALSGCTALTSLNVNGLSGTFGSDFLSSCKSSLTTLKIDGITKLGWMAFRDFTSLETISLESVSTLSYGVFYNCKSLKVLSLPSYDGAFDLNYLYQTDAGAVLSLEEQATYALTTLDLPKVTSISNATDFLEGMPHLTTLKLPSLTSYSYGTLEGLTDLEYLDLSSADLNLVVSDGTMLFGGNAPADNQCTLVLNEKYKTAAIDGESYTYVPESTGGGYSGVSWMGVVWADVIFTTVP